MRFEQLRTSMKNNAGEAPSLYMAVCMMQSLVEDVEEESGVDFEKCELGNEGLSTKLLWLCRTLLAVYQAQEENFARNRERLKAAMEQLETAETALEGFAGIAKELAEARASLVAAGERLDAAKDQADRAAELREQTRRLEKEAAELQRFDPEAEQAHIRELEAETAKLRRRIGAFHAEELEPVERQLNAATGELARKMEEKTALETQCVEAEKRRDALILAIAERKSALEKLTDEYGEREHKLGYWEEKLRDAKERMDRLTAEDKAQLELLKALQDASDVLEQTGLPEKRLLVKAEKDRRTELENRLSSAEEEARRLRGQTEDLETRCAEAEKDIRVARDTLDALTADFSGKTKELQELDSQLLQLENKDVAQKYETYRRQKEEKLRAMREMQEQSDLLEGENRELDGRVETAKRRLDELNASKKKKTDAEDGLNARIRELSAVITPEYQHRAGQLSERFAQLNQARSALCASQAQLREQLGLPAEADGSILADAAGETLRSLGHSAERYRNELIKCAQRVNDSLKWKENEQ